MRKKIEFISTGNEIMSGMTLDTNFNWIAQQLASKGIVADFHTSVGDDEKNLVACYSNAFERARFVIVSGGLGPTDDDLAASTAASFFGVDLELNQSALNSIKEKLDKRGRKILPVHRKQALFPTGSELIENPMGTSPGFKFNLKGAYYYFLPGVPREFKNMVSGFVIPDIVKDSDTSEFYKSKVIKTVGLGESEVAEKINKIDFGDSKLSYRIYFPEIHIKIVSSGSSEEQVDKKLNDLSDQCMSNLGEYFFSSDDALLEEVVADLLKKTGLTLAAAESCTGGLLSSRLTDIAGSSAYFLRSVVSYSNNSKVDMLGVDRDEINKFGAVSQEVVEAMASGVKKISGADIGVAISGIAGPGGGTREKPVGTVYFGVDYKNKKVFSRKRLFAGTRREIKLISSEYMLDTIRSLIINDV